MKECIINPCSGVDVRLGVAECSVSESSCNSGRCTAIKIIDGARIHKHRGVRRNSRLDGGDGK